jgi:hypothetical protein
MDYYSHGVPNWKECMFCRNLVKVTKKKPKNPLMRDFMVQLKCEKGHSYFVGKETIK